MPTYLMTSYRYVKRVIWAFSEDQVTFLAAGLCYFVFFSFFPLVLVLVSVAGYFLSAEEAMRQTMKVVTDIFPHQQGFLIDVLRGVMEHRGEASLLGFAALLWSAKNVFMSFGHAMNVIWKVPDRAWIVENLLATVMAVSVGLMIVLFSVAFGVANALINYRIPLIGWSPTMIPGFIPALVWLAPLVVSVGVLVVLYKVLPNRTLAWQDVGPAAVATAVLWDVVRRLFGWYLDHVAQYDMVYGSLGGIVGFLFWIYVSASIFLLGVELAKAGLPEDTPA